MKTITVGRVRRLVRRTQPKSHFFDLLKAKQEEVCETLELVDGIFLITKLPDAIQKCPWRTYRLDERGHFNFVGSREGFKSLSDCQKAVRGPTAMTR
jgi:hypothetical protein